LAQAGEFGFVLLTLAQQNELVPRALLNPILASMVLSMLATPFLVMYSNKIVMKLVSSDWLQQSLQMTGIARKAMGANKHVIICGYGRCGQNLARLLTAEKIPYIALDLDPDRVHQAAAAGDKVVYGDAVRLQALMAAGLARASAVVVTYLDTPSAMKVLANTRSHAPKVPVIVRTVDDHDIEKLQLAGATEVVPEAIEGSLMLASHALALVGVPMRRVIRVVQEQRDARYNLLRGYFHGNDDDTADEIGSARLGSVTLTERDDAVNKQFIQIVNALKDVQVISLKRKNGQQISLSEAHAFADAASVLGVGDTLVLSGKPEALDLAEKQLVNG
jgi:CPA2 family monovalent cation:H+ antiporter-2